MSKLFSPSLKLRSEPPNSKAKVMHVGTDTALVNFRGRSLTAKLLDDSIVAGDSVSIIECPRNVYHIKKTGPSWYANPLENWAKAGKKACVALEYLLRKNKKWSPFVTGSDGTLLGKDPTTDPTGFGTPAGFAALDTNGDGGIDIEEWTAAGGDPTTFAQLDTNGDGVIDIDEFTRGGFNGGLDGATPGSMGGTPQAVTGGAVPAGWDAYSGPADVPDGFNPEDYVDSWYGFIEYTYADPASVLSLNPYITQSFSGTIKTNLNYSEPAYWMGHAPGDEYYYGKPLSYPSSWGEVPVSSKRRIFFSGAAGATFDRLMIEHIETTTMYQETIDSEGAGSWTLYYDYLNLLKGFMADDMAQLAIENPIFVLSQNGGPLASKPLNFAYIEDNTLYPSSPPGYTVIDKYTGIVWAEVRI